jgi:hypothetical protein
MCCRTCASGPPDSEAADRTLQEARRTRFSVKLSLFRASVGASGAPLATPRQPLLLIDSHDGASRGISVSHLPNQVASSGSALREQPSFLANQTSCVDASALPDPEIGRRWLVATEEELDRRGPGRREIDHEDACPEQQGHGHHRDRHAAARSEGPTLMLPTRPGRLPLSCRVLAHSEY